MTQAPAPRIFDRRLLRLRLARALRFGAASFLLERVAEDMEERLGAIMRPFDKALDLCSPGPQIAQMLATRKPELLVRAASVPEGLGQGDWLGLLADEEALPFAPESFDLIVAAPCGPMGSSWPALSAARACMNCAPRLRRRRRRFWRA